MVKQMKRALPLLVILGFAAFTMIAFTADAAADGKALFLQNKCNMCHTIDALQIAKLSGKKTEGGPPDLSTVGSRHNAEWITKFLKKETEQNGKKHMKTFTGKPEDLQTIASWLETLKGQK
jgi:mono/diheme cytochrome c family protein